MGGSGTVNIRELALNMLMEITANRAYSHVLMKQVLDKYDYLDSRDKAFLKRLTEGTLERMIQLDYVIDACSKVPVRKQKPMIRSLLRLSVYQLLFMDSVPDSAVCNEAVKLAQKRGFGTLKGFVNGVLRSIARQKDTISLPDREQDEVQYLSVRYSMPVWIAKMWLEDYGTQLTETILDGLLGEHPVSIRLRESQPKQEREAVLRRLEEQGVQCEKNPYLPYAYSLLHTENVAWLEDFKNGAFYVQDVASMLVAEAAGIQGGEQILDVCAAPGGKSLHVADKLLCAGKGGSIKACDVSEDKTALIEENIRRLHLEEMVHTGVADARIQQEEWIGLADIVIADVPCSGLGIIGKKRDIKYHMTKEKIEELDQLQREILSMAQSYLKPGGVLLFSTCTINRRENEQRLQWLLEEFALEPVSLEPVLPKELWCDTADKGYVQLLPGVHAADGFFIAKLCRTGEKVLSEKCEKDS